MSETISDLLLHKSGYSEYEHEAEYGDRFFEKKFTDAHGVKYVLNVKYYFFTQNGEQLHFWDFSMQLETEKGSVNFVTVQWFNQDGAYSGRTIAEAEAYFEWLWKQHGKPYHEEYASGEKK